MIDLDAVDARRNQERHTMSSGMSDESNQFMRQVLKVAAGFKTSDDGKTFTIPRVPPFPSIDARIEALIAERDAAVARADAAERMVTCPICEGAEMSLGQHCIVNCDDGKVRWTSANALTNARLGLEAWGTTQERARIVTWLREQGDSGTAAASRAITGSTLQRDLVAGVVAIKRAATAIEAGTIAQQAILSA